MLATHAFFRLSAAIQCRRGRLASPANRRNAGMRIDMMRAGEREAIQTSESAEVSL